MKNYTLPFLCSMLCLFAFNSHAQVAQNGFLLQRDLGLPASEQLQAFIEPWGGGMNSCQYSNIDWNRDGIDDLLIFDRAGNVVMPMLNNNQTGQSSYTYAPEYAEVWPFPELKDWVIMRDYNCDDRADIFASTVGGIKVYRNISTSTTLAFELVTINPPYLASNYIPTTTNIFVTSADIPAVYDVDNDNDLDIITFSIFGTVLDYHKNLSQESGFGCDSLIFEIRSRCWGYVSENLNNNSVSLNDTCNNNIPNNELDPNLAEGLRHVGSTVTALDLDGDTVTDLLLGDISYTNITALYNDGTATHAHIGSQDTVFPAYDTSVDNFIFPASFYVDVDNDGRRDLMTSPNNYGLSINKESSHFYKNNGTDQSPIFNFVQPDLFQADMIDFGTGAYPIPFDYNGDAAMDLLVGNFGYFALGGNFPSQLALFENVGNDSTPSFNLIDRDFASLSTSGLGSALKPTLGDLDGDGDADMMIGDLQGRIHYYENTPTGGFANFTQVTVQVQDNNGSAIDVGQFATPHLFDVNDDGLLDMLIGERNGNVNYYRNLGTVSTPIWSLQIDSIGGVVTTEWWNITGYSVPYMYLNNANERELVLGSESGGIFLYDNIEGNINGSWNLVDSILQGLDEGIRTAPCVYDFTGDGLLDLIVGNHRGGLSFFRNDIFTGFEEHLGNNDVSIFPNPTNSAFSVDLKGAIHDGELRVYSMLGKLIYSTPVNSKKDLTITTDRMEFRNLHC